MLRVVVCVHVYVFSVLEVGSGVDESRDCVSSWSVPEVVWLDDLDTWSYPCRDVIGWCDFSICCQTIGWCGFLTRVPAGRVGWFGSLPSRRPVFYMGCSVVWVCACVRACVSTLKKIKFGNKIGIGIKWTQTHCKECFERKERKCILKWIWLGHTQLHAYWIPVGTLLSIFSLPHFPYYM